MTDILNHECGIAFLRLLKPIEYYKEKYGTEFYGLQKMFLLMQKQHNRGQDGIGLANIKLDVPPGKEYFSRHLSVANNAIENVFAKVNQSIETKFSTNSDPSDKWIKENVPFTGELFLGHLRYGTYGTNNIKSCHPFVRESNWRSKFLCLAGNFNLTNVSEINDKLINLGQSPHSSTDSEVILEKIGHFLDSENEKIFQENKDLIYGPKMSKKIETDLDIANILKRASHSWDGGYVIAGMTGHGDSFILRDQNGIRPAYYYKDDEVLVVASERAAIFTSFNIDDNVHPVEHGCALICKKDGTVTTKRIFPELKRRSCSFERIYFSRGSDIKIYRERKKLGALIVPKLTEILNGELKNTVLSYIPNTAEISYQGMVEEFYRYSQEIAKKKILELSKNNHPIDSQTLDNIMDNHIRNEKIAIKDAKLRTFISQDSGRDKLVSHVYDITYGIIQKQDTLVVVDDSIVRGTTLKKSILRILDRLKPKKIIVISSAPQIRYPDCYGIDMADLGKLIAFQATIDLIKKRFPNDFNNIMETTYKNCKAELEVSQPVNKVKALYDYFTEEELSHNITNLLKPTGMNAELDIIFQPLANLHIACPNHLGDWYFSGIYPTRGGINVANRSFIRYYEGKEGRAY